MNASHAYLRQLVDHFGRDLTRLPAFILDHGREFEPDAKTFKGRRMQAKNCFGNAAVLALRDPGLTYVEGYIHALIPIHHAWLTRADGSIVEPTLSLTGLNGTSRGVGGYFGVPFQTAFLSVFLLSTRSYGLLDGMSEESRNLITGKVPVEAFLATQEPVT